MSEHSLKLAFVFDGAPPVLKAREIEKRRAVKKKYEEDHAAAVERGDLAEAYSKATMTSKLTREMVAEARELLRLMGVPTVQAPSEGEAQAAYMAATSPDIWAAASKDYDSLLFGAPRLVRFLSISGKEFLPSQGTFRPIVPETIVLAQLLEGWGITREGLVDLAMLARARAAARPHRAHARRNLRCARRRRRDRRSAPHLPASQRRRRFRRSARHYVLTATNVSS